MIYFVSREQRLFPLEGIQQISVEESLKLLEPLKIVGLDTETDSLDCWTGNLLSLQLGCKEFQVVIDCKTIDVELYKEYLESDRLFLGWNLKFDLKWLFRKGIIVKKVWDGFLMEKLLWLGYPVNLTIAQWNRIKEPRYDYVPPATKGIQTDGHYVLFMNLKKAGEIYCGVELDKTIRGQIIWNGLSEDVIRYAAKDVEFLEAIRDRQLVELEKKDLLRATEYENRFVIPLAYCEYCGVKLDIDKWKRKMEKDKERLLECKNALDKWLIENEPDNKYVVIDRQGDLFLGYNLSPKVTINWNSTAQVLPIFKKYGVGVNAKGKDSLEAKALKPFKDKCSLIPLYIKYKEAMKVTTTYGQNVLDTINPVTGRIMGNYSQLGTDTGRLSSGGEGTINLQNLPSDKETRECFISEEGNKFISIDFCGEESCVMASIANDKAMIHELMGGEKDLHTLTAKIVYPQIPKDMSAKEVKEKFHDLRSKAKRYEFAMNYLGNANTLKTNYGISEEEANRVYKAYMSGFSGLKKYQDFRIKDWYDKGYILINPVSGHKAFIYDYKALKEDEEWMRTLDWDYYREMKKSNPDCYTVERVRHYFKRKAGSSKQSGNYPIQGTSALIFKVATVYFWNKILENGWFDKVKLCIPVHDEWDIEAPNDIAQEVADTLHSCMVKAGAFFCTRCKLDAEISYNEDGSLPNYWIH